MKQGTASEFDRESDDGIEGEYQYYYEDPFADFEPDTFGVPVAAVRAVIRPGTRVSVHGDGWRRTLAVSVYAQHVTPLALAGLQVAR